MKTLSIKDITYIRSECWEITIDIRNPDNTHEALRVVGNYINIIDHIKSNDENISHNAQEALIHEVLQNSDIMVLDYSQFTYKFGRYVFMNEDYYREILELNK